MPGHWLLHDDATYCRVARQLAHESLGIVLRRVVRQGFVAARHAGQLCLAMFVAHIHLRRAVVTNQHGGKARHARQFTHFSAHLRHNVVTQRIAVQYQRPTSGAGGFLHCFHAIALTRVG